MDLASEARVTAVLGPTNTGKTHYAIERMLTHRTGVIGLPLRLLAREIYDRIVALRGPSVVALVTGEERIVPPRAAWWVCTVEAMPTGIGADFLAVDEIQLCADPDRGHVFTDRLLHARGTTETLFLGSDTMRGPIAHLVHGTTLRRRDRLSKLSWTGPRKLSRMPARSAIVGFSTDDVYAIAELIRRQRGGAAVVMGALSPRTRNAQVELYQNGDVDFLVATDAIGMGLNLDITHVAFSGVVKFDGRRHRHLAPNELAQIAGRAGRYTQDGTFGVTGEAPPLDADVIEAIENSQFAPLRRLQWRSNRLDFTSAEALAASLEAPSDHPDLVRAREADDLATLKALAALPDVRRRLNTGADVRLLWDVCQVPDFRKVSLQEHASLASRLYVFLNAGGRVPADWLAAQVSRIDRTDGDIDSLSKRLAYIRTWTYVAQRNGWVDDADHWRGETRAVEDRLSDALHLRLTQRFVDRRTSVLMRRLKQRESLVATVTDSGEVSIDDQFVGRLEGFRFRLDPAANPEEKGTLRTAGLAALGPVLSLRADRFYNAPDTEIDVTEQGGLMWGEHAVGRLAAGNDVLAPQILPFVDEDAAPEIAEKVRRRLGHWLDRRIAALFQPLLALRDDEALTGMARGIAFRLVEAMGVLPRAEITDDVKALDQDGRASLRKHGVRFGQYTVFMPLMLKPAPTRLRLVLWSLKEGFDIFPEASPPGLVTVAAVPDAPRGYYPRIGYRLAGDRAIRIDMLERLADLIRPLDPRGGFEAAPEMLSITGLSLDQFAKLMQGLGYEATPGTRPRRMAAAATPAPEGAPVVAETPEPDQPAPDAPQPELPVPGPDLPESPPLEEPVPEVPDAPTPGGPTEIPEQPDEVPATPDEVPPEQIPEDAPTIDPVNPPTAEAPAETAEAGAEPAAPGEVESFYTFTRSPRRRPERAPQGQGRGQGQRGRRGAAAGNPEGSPQTGAGEARPAEGTGGERQESRPENRRHHGKPGGGTRPEGKDGKPPRRHDGPKGKPRRDDERPRPEGERVHSARPPRSEKPIDPDNPFAALMALKLKS